MHNLGVPADKTRTLPADRGSDRRRRALARGAPHRMAARGTRFQSHRLRSRHRLRQERTAIVATAAQHRALSALTGCACSSGTRANRSCITLRPRAAPSAISSPSALRCGCATAASTSCACTTLRCTPRPIAAGRTRADLMTDDVSGDSLATSSRCATSRPMRESRCVGRAAWSKTATSYSPSSSQRAAAYKAGPKRTAQAKRTAPRLDTPPDEYVWRNDTLRLMLPGQRHSVSLSWGSDAGHRRLLKYFVNLEEPYRRTERGIRHAGPHVGRRNHA